ncbi:MAG: molybdopterin-dependent oxidoreductase, partial [Myxococcota bacterium]
MAETTTSYRTCLFCEATCGIEVTLRDSEIVKIRGDKDDPFSRGYICPKAYGLKGLHEDPDRLTAPVKRTENGWEEISWSEAYALAIDGLTRVRDDHGAQALGTYLGNPNAHNMHTLLYGPFLQRSLGTKQRFSATSADQLPKQLTADLMFGGSLNIPIPDVDRTQFFLILGANPMVSNGSLMTAPNLPKRLKEIRERGGRIVVIDPRRTETAAIADAHHFIRPGGDAFLLLGMIHVLFRDERAALGALANHVEGVEAVREAVASFTPERMSARCGIDASVIESLAHEFADADAAVCYGRLGTTCQEFGTVSSWAVDVLNTLTGNLDRPGGAMFVDAAVKSRSLRPPKPSRVKFDRWRSRVDNLPEAFGELPVAVLPN